MKFHGIWVPPPYPQAFFDHGRTAQQEPSKPSIFFLQNCSGKIYFFPSNFFSPFLIFFCQRRPETLKKSFVVGFGPQPLRENK